MRNHEERVAETKRRIAKIEREKRLRRNKITMASVVAACLVLLIGASLAMPGIAASHAGRNRGALLPLPQSMACACVRRAAAGVLLHLRGHSLQPALVRHDDMALLLLHSRTGLRQRADGRGAEDAVLPHRRAVLCCLGVPALDGGLLLAGYFSGKPNLLV